MRFFTLALLLCSGVLTAQVAVSYSASAADFANPERGFYRYSETRSGNYTPLDASELASYRSFGTIPGADYDFVSTLVFRYFFLEDFTAGPISESYLENISNDMAAVRQAGLKVIPRFAYTDELDDSCGNFICPPYGDAPKDVVLAHIDQLAPILQANGDIIATVQMGFIGTWGEQYYTDHFGDASAQGKLLDENWADRIEVLEALLDVLPKNRTVQVRYPQMKQKAIYGISAPTTSEATEEAEAYSGSNKARIGFHNDCLLSSFNDVGTYLNYGTTDDGSESDTATLKPYFAADSRFVPVGGETCSDNYSPENDCATGGGFAAEELRRMHYSYLNSGYNNEVNNDWVAGGCMEDIKRELGYRFELQEGSLPTAAAQGASLKIELFLNNTGYTAPFNERNVEFILRGKEDGAVFVARCDVDPRTWYPEEQRHRISEEFCIPEDMPLGTFEMLLNFPDPAASLRSRPEYSIRLASTFNGEEVWEPATGYNRLGADLVIRRGQEVECRDRTTFAALAVVLPVGFEYVHATPGPKSITLDWATSYEEDNAGFEVERSEDGNRFTRIATVAPRGAGEYSLEDSDVREGDKYFYRVRQRDFDGTSQLSAITSASVRGAQELVAYPNPASDLLTINYATGVLDIVDQTGRSVSFERSGEHVNISNLKAGVYLLTLQEGSRRHKTRIVVR